MSSATQLGSSIGQQSLPATMQAAVYRGVNDVRLETVPVPKIGPGEILVRVRACGICGSDIHGYDGSSGRRIPPLVMGHEAAGTVADEVLADGEQIVQALGDRNVIPVTVLRADPGEPDLWLRDARAAIDVLLLGR